MVLANGGAVLALGGGGGSWLSSELNTCSGRILGTNPNWKTHDARDSVQHTTGCGVI